MIGGEVGEVRCAEGRKSRKNEERVSRGNRRCWGRGIRGSDGIACKGIAEREIRENKDEYERRIRGREVTGGVVEKKGWRGEAGKVSVGNVELGELAEGRLMGGILGEVRKGELWEGDPAKGGE